MALALTTPVLGCSRGTDFEKLTVVTYPGFDAPSPPESECETASYPGSQSVDASSHVLTWDYCQLNADFTHAAPQQGNRTLTDAEFQSVTDALNHVEVTNGHGCGEDASVVTLDLQNQHGVERYANDFYAGCPGQLQEGRTFASGLEELARVTQMLAR